VHRTECDPAPDLRADIGRHKRGQARRQDPLADQQQDGYRALKAMI